jgi:hypothetical protein
MTEQNTTQVQELTIQDLATLRSIIEISSERNTFKVGEMAAVGLVYNKLDAFLKAVEAQQAALAAQAAAAPEKSESAKKAKKDEAYE